MCFSASVSYGSAALLISTGAVTTLGNTSKQHRMIAAIPFLFGIQQAAEGVVWQSMGSELVGGLSQYGALLFVAVALVAWPSWLPWSLYQVEENKKRKTILKVIGFMGLGVSLLAASVVGHSLGYSFLNMKRFWPASIDFLIYDIPTMIPFFVSSLRTVKKAGYLVFAGMVLAQAINREATTSIWCFFAAVVSLYIAVNVLWGQRGRLV
ncbi:MAG: hypothetical protein KUL82_06195 [Bdellovibrio sp.]|nr:hypothetical protein [Bdellovibrio sp.]